MSIARLATSGLFAISLSVSAAGTDPAAAAAADIDKVNRDWGTAMVHGDAATVAAAYTEDAVFCDTAGDCTKGRAAILKMTRERLAQGLPKSATARSERRVAADGFVYEWGGARIVTADGRTRGGHYLTVWQRQTDGHWLIYRNLVLP